MEKGEESMFSLRFRSVAEMAGWDEEVLLIANLVVEDTPDRQIKHKRRTKLPFKTPPTNSRRKRRGQRSPVPVAVLNLDSDDESSKQDVESIKMESRGSDIPCMDRLREELSCAIEEPNLIPFENWFLSPKFITLSHKTIDTSGIDSLCEIRKMLEKRQFQEKQFLIFRYILEQDGSPTCV